MKNILLLKLKDSLVAALPVAAIVFFLNLTPLVDFSGQEIGVFAICTIFLVIGIGLFNLGADLAMTPMGEHIGAGLAKTRKITLLLIVCFAMGLLITVAEPDLSVLAGEVSAMINETTLIMTVGIGVALFLVLAVVKIITGKSLSAMLMFFYMLLFALSALIIINENTDFLALSFDSGGVTTGPITVPFIMALGVGIAATLGGKNVSENSFGLIAMCSIGPILAVTVLGISASGDMTYKLPDYSIPSDLFGATLHSLAETARSVAIALGLIVAFFAVLQIFCLKLPKKKLWQIAIGIGYTYVGLVMFLTAVHIGFMPIGYKLGTELASKHPNLLPVLGFIIGMVVVLAEPAVHVLNKQVEEITEGTVSRRSMVIALSCGVGVSICLSMLRIIFDFSILYYVIPGYMISLGLSFFVPGMYTAIAFDSGGVASGPLTSTFILPLAVGACFVLQGEAKVMTDAYGIVAMVAMTPLITIQLLGFRAVVTKKVRDNIAMKQILSAEDEQIIKFM